MQNARAAVSNRLSDPEFQGRLVNRLTMLCVAMATVTSAPGVVDTVRKATTTAITQNVIAKGSAFYYVLVDAPTINLAFLGVQIDVRPTC